MSGTGDALARPAPADAAPATAAEKASYVLSAAALLFVFLAHLVPALVAGLLVHTVLHRTQRLLTHRRLSHGLTKTLAAGLLVVLAAGVAVLSGWGLFAFARGHVGDLPGLFARMADVLDRAREQLAAWGLGSGFLEGLRTADQLKGAAAEWLREHGSVLTAAGGHAGRLAVHGLMGVFAAVLVFLRQPSASPRPLAGALAARVRRFGDAFERIVIAQAEISAVNTVLTAVYLLGLLPLLGARLPMTTTLILVTFVAGLLPVVGNLVSNTVIVVVSFGVAPWLALLSLGFLVGVHKLEYLVNARIVGNRIGAQAWEIFLAIVVFEVAFGIAGVVLAPIVYAWVKGELRERDLV